MELTPVEVRCYAGYKADETPREFRLQEAWIEVEEVLRSWYQEESLPETPRAEWFKVRGKGGDGFLLKHDLESDQWYLVRRV